MTIRLLGSDDFPAAAKEQAAAGLTTAAQEGALSVAVGPQLSLASAAQAHERVDAGTRERVLLAIDHYSPSRSARIRPQLPDRITPVMTGATSRKESRQEMTSPLDLRATTTAALVVDIQKTPSLDQRVDLRQAPPTPLINLVPRERRAQGTICYTRDDYRAVIDLMAQGHYDTTGRVDTLPFSGAVERGFEELRAGRPMRLLVDATA